MDFTQNHCVFYKSGTPPFTVEQEDGKHKDAKTSVLICEGG
jgi:hypothetical protein